MTIKLSICIPTYKRAPYLAECLESIVAASREVLDRIEIVISDNASPDDTPQVVARYATYFIHFNACRQTENIGGERNFAAVAKMAKGEYIWVFGDDDKMAVTAINEILARIDEGYDLTICNHSAWSKDFSSVKTAAVLPIRQDRAIQRADEVLRDFGLNLGYISTIIIRKALFFKLPAEEYESFVEYGFPFAYAAYVGIQNAGPFAYIAAPLVHNRTSNAANFDWYKYFVTGSSLIFDALQARGYSAAAVRRAKSGVISQYVVHDLLVRKRDCVTTKGLSSLMWPHYKRLPLFWLAILPAILMPGRLVYASWRCMKTGRALLGK